MTAQDLISLIAGGVVSVVVLVSIAACFAGWLEDRELKRANQD